MKWTFMKTLPIAAVMLLAVSCDKDEYDDSDVFVAPEVESVDGDNAKPTAPEEITPDTPDFLLMSPDNACMKNKLLKLHQPNDWDGG